MIKEPLPIVTEFEKILDGKMRSLLGGRDWSVWRTDAEPEMYNTILLAMYDYGNKVRKNTKKEIIALIKKQRML